MVTTWHLPMTRQRDARREFDALLLQHYTRAYRLAYQMLGNRGDAEDLTQEAFLRAWRGFHLYDPTRPFDRWLLRIVNNLAIDFYRRRKRLEPLSLDTPFHNAADGTFCFLDVPSVDADPARIVLEAECSEEVQQAFNALPPPFRVTLLLLDMYQQTYAEAAEILGIQVGTVRSRVHRGRKMLRHLLTTGQPYHRQALNTEQK